MFYENLSILPASSIISVMHNTHPIRNVQYCQTLQVGCKVDPSRTKRNTVMSLNCSLPPETNSSSKLCYHHPTSPSHTHYTVLHTTQAHSTYSCVTKHYLTSSSFTKHHLPLSELKLNKQIICIL